MNRRLAHEGEAAQARDSDLVLRNLVVVLGDQLSLSSAAFDGFEAAHDRVWMAEVREESEHVPSTKMRTAIFLSAMRHFAAALSAQGMPVDCLKLGEHRFASIESALADALSRRRPRAVVMVEAGEWRLEQAVARACEAAGVRLVLRDDRHFMASRAEFTEHAHGKRRLVMEAFYRHMRVKHRVMVDKQGRPEGGQWNFDHDNRAAFGRDGPGMLPPPPSFAPDAITREVLDDVETHFGNHYGSAEGFDWPVTREQALAALDDFVEFRLQDFGRFQDAMWTDEPFLYHGLLSSCLNLKLLDPREVIDAAVARWRAGRVPIESVEGFVRQILGWREFIHGVYWWRMPELADANALQHHENLPDWYWSGDVRMNCMKQVISQTMRTGYAHHIQRLMVTGNFALTFGMAPAQVHAWYLSVYVDAVEWVELPNTVGVSLFADGARFATKPYAAGGAYIRRMSNYCDGCRYQPGTRSGSGACPMTVMYWDFVARHEKMLENNPRTVMMTRNLQRFGADERAAIRKTADAMRERPDLL
jgi:deoxyribodipyrimidine photolyase-related protein